MVVWYRRSAAERDRREGSNLPEGVQGAGVKPVPSGCGEHHVLYSVCGQLDLRGSFLSTLTPVVCDAAAERHGRAAAGPDEKEVTPQDNPRGEVLS